MPATLRSAAEPTSAGQSPGIEIEGLDLGGALDEPTFAMVRDALHRASVVVIRGQSLTVPQLRAFCMRFGEPEPHATKYSLPDYRDVLCVSNILDEGGRPIGIVDAGRMWHTDGHFEERPTMYSILYAVEVPRDSEGRSLGSTWFTSTADAYDRLPGALKVRLEGRVAETTIAQAYRYYEAQGLATKRVSLTDEQRRKVGRHPVIRTHPHTGRRCIYVSEGQTERILDLPEAEGRALIAELQHHYICDAPIYRHRWAEGDVVIWDNCSAQHYAVGDYSLPQRRLMYRMSVAGSPTV